MDHIIGAQALERKLARFSDEVSGVQLRKRLERVAEASVKDVDAAVRADLGDNSMSNWSRRQQVAIVGAVEVKAGEVAVVPKGQAKGPMRVLESGRQSYSIDAVNDFDPFFLELSTFCKQHDLGVETLIHEAGAGQMEINFSHGDPMDLADRVFLFKRTVRETALRHGIFATFMAKPMEQEPGSAMHIHQSILDAEGNNLFSLPDGSASPLFGQCIAGLQAYIPQLMPMFAPYVNSYRRLSPFMSAPINVRWGHDNRTCGIRIPKSSPANRRVENRVPGVDVNPYLAMAATLACCYLGMTQGLMPSAPTTDSAWNVSHELPRHLEDAIASMRSCEPMREVLGAGFVDAFCAVKELEYATYNRVISSWEREHLLLLV